MLASDEELFRLIGKRGVGFRRRRQQAIRSLTCRRHDGSDLPSSPIPTTSVIPVFWRLESDGLGEVGVGELRQKADASSRPRDQLA